MQDTLFDHPFSFELDDTDISSSFIQLQEKYSSIPETILFCEYERLHYKFHIPLEEEVQHAQNTEGWKLLRTKYLTSSSIATIVPSTSEIAGPYRGSISKSKRIEDLSKPKAVQAVQKRIAKYVIEKIENHGIGNNMYLRWGKKFENVAKHLLQLHIGLEHPIIDVNLQRHQTESSLATSLDGDIPSLNAVAEFKCIYFTTKFYPTIDWKYHEQLQSQLDASNREKGYWLMCQFDAYTLGSKPYEDEKGYENWLATLDVKEDSDSMFIKNGIMLKDMNRYETFKYPPMHLRTPKDFWDWMIESIEAEPPSTYYPVFWKLLKHNLLVIKREPDWLKKRLPIMRAVMRMIHFYRDPKHAEEFLAFKDKHKPPKPTKAWSTRNDDDNVNAEANIIDESIV